MDKGLSEYLNVLQVGIDEIEITMQAKEYLLSKKIKFLSDNKEDVARLFYQILCSFQRILGNDAAGKVGEQVIVLFEHIALINTDSDTQSDDSNLMTIWFLNELYQKARAGRTFAIDDDKLKESIESLLIGLNDIHFIFKIEKEGSRIFPIDRLISKAISENKFMEMDSITPYHVRMFQLAVELFDEQDDKRILEKLKAEDGCNLRFLDYMDGSHEIIDTENFLNYQKNGVMIFYSHRKKSILIRHEKKTYFCIKEKYPKNGVKEEKNHQQDTIGYYVTIDNIKNVALVDFSNVMSKNPMQILQLIYEQNYFNIFHEKSLYLDGEDVQPVNPYAVNDKYIVKGYINRGGKWYTKDQLQKVIRKYRMMMIAGHAIDRVTFGLCQNLLEKNNVGIKKLELDNISNDDWLQNNVIKNWVLASRNPKDALKYILKKICVELGYCNNPLERYDIVTQDIFPYSFDFRWMYKILEVPQNSYSIFQATVEEGDEGNLYLHINSSKTMAGKNFSGSTDIDLEELDFYNMLSDNDKEEYSEIGVEHYIVFDAIHNQWTGRIEDEMVYQYLAQTELLMYRNSLPFPLRDLIDVNHINDIGGFMKLHEEALMAVGDEHSVFADFDSMMIYRLIHTLIWNKITMDTWENFYNIVHQHQKLVFSDIRKDTVFKRQEMNALYVPKDNSGSDGTLCKAYYKYASKKIDRDRNNPFNPKIVLSDNGKYLINGVKIEKIIFLFDNTCSGTGTCNTLAFYLNREDLVSKDWNDIKKQKFRNTQQVYPVDSKVVSVHEIMKVNNVTDICIHSYYGTAAGVAKIKDLLQKCGYSTAIVNYTHEIDHYYQQIEKDAKKVWPKEDGKEQNYCLFIREFNQPKINVFPKPMLEDANRAICIFVQKQE